MSEKYQDSQPGARSTSAFGLFKAMFNRWGFSGKPDDQAPARTSSVSQKLARPASFEVSPATVNPFPEPKTMPGGWDLSEMLKSRG